MITETKKYIVFYSLNLQMRERIFESESEANTFSNEVKGSVVPINFKTVPVSKVYKKELSRIKKFGY